MLLSGWTQPPSAPEKADKSTAIGNGASTSVEVREAEKDELDMISAGKKRRHSEITEVADSELPNAADETRNHKQLQVIDDEDDLVVLEGNSDGYKRKRLQ